METNRSSAWDAVGKDLIGAKSIDEALKMAELDFEVNKQKLYLNKGGMKVVDDFFANVRSDNGQVLGVVTDRYKIVQNRDAFSFVDSLIDEGVEFEKGGVFHFGKSAWLEAKIPESYKILGDDVESHIVLVNSHDGKGAVKVNIIPLRLFCSNQLNMALRKAKRSWSANHSVRIDGRIKEAQETLGLADAYMKELAKTADELAVAKMSDDEFRAILDKVYPVDESMSARKITTTNEKKAGLMQYLEQPDLANFRGTKWGVVGAITDYFDHTDGQRITKNFAENRLEKIVNGHKEIDYLIARVVA